MMNYPKVTIGVTSFNAVDSIALAIDSALNQTWRPIEIVVVDDCSTDGTWELIGRLSKVHPELRIFRNEVNQGVAASRNRIIKEAKGEFIAFFDDDDESLPSRVSEQYYRIVNYEKNFSNGQPVICHTARKLCYSNGEMFVEPTMGQKDGEAAPSGVTVALRILMGYPLKDGYGACATCSQMARVEVYKNLNCFDGNLRRSEDTEFNIRLAIAGGHFVGIEKPLVVQRMTMTNEKSLNDEYRNGMLVLEKHKSLIEEYGSFNFCKNFLEAKHLWLKGNYVRFLFKFSSIILRHPYSSIRRLSFSVNGLKSNILFSRFHRMI